MEGKWREIYIRINNHKNAESSLDPFKDSRIIFLLELCDYLSRVRDSREELTEAMSDSTE